MSGFCPRVAGRSGGVQMLRHFADFFDRLNSSSQHVRRCGPPTNFHADERGGGAVIFAIVVCAVILAVAVAIDYARTVRDYTRSQNALDSAALAAAHRLGLPDQDTPGRNDRDVYFKGDT